MNQEQKHYYAFISHSSEDEKTAKWLCKQLEGYHIPTTIQKEYQAPKRLKPIFLFQADLAGNKLRAALEGELKDSKYLIVICSPSSAKSDYVNEEVLHFINSGRYDKIIPFIVDGKPFASVKGNAEEECFPPALVALRGTEKELRGIDLREEKKHRGSKKAAVIDVIATMLGVRFDVLWDRYRHRRIRQYCLAALLCLLVCLGGFFLWDYNRPMYRYFADYVDRWGVPEGVIELSEEQQNHRSYMYQFEYRRTPFGEPNAYAWRVTAVRYVNSAHTPQKMCNTELLSRYPIQEISYHKVTGHVATIAYEDEYGRILIKHQFSDVGNQRAVKVDFTSPHDQQGDGFLSANMNNLRTQTMNSLGMHPIEIMSNIKRYIYGRDDNGYIVSISYRKNNDDDIAVSATSDADGVYGIKMELDSLGRCVRMTYVDKNEQPMATPIGIASKEYTYDKYGNIWITKNLDIHGNLVANEQLWAIGEDISNEDGNCCWQKYYDAYGHLSPNIFGCCQDEAIYDNHGNVIERRSMNEAGELCCNIYGWAIQKMEYNKQGCVIKNSFFNTKSKSCCDSQYGVASMKCQYDCKNRLISATSYGLDGEKLCTKQGYARIEREYEGNNVVSCACYDADGAYCINKEINAVRHTYEFDSNDNLIRLSSYSDEENLRIVGLGAVECRKLLPNGNVEEVYFLNENQERFNNMFGFNRMKMTYNNSGQVVETQYYNKDDQLCMNADMYAIQRLSYDELKNGMSYMFSIYDTQNKPCMGTAWNAFAVKIENNQNGKPLSLTYYDTLNMPCNNSMWFAKQVNQYDSCGRLVETAYYRYKDGKFIPCTIRDNYSIIRYKYNKYGKLIETSTYNELGKPQYLPLTCSKSEMDYDEYGRNKEQRFYIEDTILYNNALGIAMFRWEYNEIGDMVKQTCYNENKEMCDNEYGVAYMTVEYNKWRSPEILSFYNKNDELVVNEDPNCPYAQIRYLYDAIGGKIGEKYYNADGEEIMIK